MMPLWNQVSVSMVKVGCLLSMIFRRWASLEVDDPRAELLVSPHSLHVWGQWEDMATKDLVKLPRLGILARLFSDKEAYSGWKIECWPVSHLDVKLAIHRLGLYRLNWWVCSKSMSLFRCTLHGSTWRNCHTWVLFVSRVMHFSQIWHGHFSLTGTRVRLDVSQHPVTAVGSSNKLDWVVVQCFLVLKWCACPLTGWWRGYL